ncbi:MAG TPA: hypothetical protein VHB97_15345, partial [Polyangia bacterium]|nr:hypothetical protein [Polyangia bacterium]
RIVEVAALRGELRRALDATAPGAFDTPLRADERAPAPRPSATPGRRRPRANDRNLGCERRRGRGCDLRVRADRV